MIYIYDRICNHAADNLDGPKPAQGTLSALLVSLSQPIEAKTLP